MAGFGKNLSMRSPRTLNPSELLSTLESEEPLPDDDPRTRNGGLDPSRQQDLAQIQFYAQARQAGALSDRAWQKLIQRNPRSAMLFSAVGVSPEVQAQKQRTDILGRYFQPETPEVAAPSGYENFDPGQQATPGKADATGAILELLSKGDIEGAKQISAFGKEKGSGSEAKLIQVDSQDEKGNKITLLVDPHTSETKRVIKGSPKLLTDSHVGKLQTYSDAFDRIDGITETFDDRYGGFGSKTVGEATQEYRKRFGDDVPFAQWWQTYQEENNAIRKELFGSALTATEKAEFEKARVHPGMSSIQIRANLDRQRAASLRAAQKLAKPFTTQNFDRRMVVDSLGRHADTILSSKVPTTKEVLQETKKPVVSGWNSDKETRYQELLRKRNGAK